MTIDSLAKQLRLEVDKATPSKEIAVTIHLFGIRYASELRNVSLPDLVARAGISDNYKTEIRKGMNLAKYVIVK